MSKEISIGLPILNFRVRFMFPELLESLFLEPLLTFPGHCAEPIVKQCQTNVKVTQ